MAKIKLPGCPPPHCQEKLCATKNRQTIAKSAAFCSFCVFAGKNDVYLANQSCKDGKSEALCHKARHRGSRGALAHKNSLLTKRREPKPQTAGFIGGKTFQGENRQTLKFCAFAKKNAVSLTKQGCKGCQNEALCRKSEALCHKKGLGVQGRFGTYKALTSQKPQAKAPDRRFHWRKNIPRRKPANSPRIRLRRILEFCAFAEKNAVS